MAPQDRHGRSLRVDGNLRRRPPEGFRLRDRQRFVKLVEDVLAGLPPTLREAARSARVVIADVPFVAPRAAATVPPVLARFDLAPRARLVVYRRAIELRAEGRRQLAGILRSAIAHAISERTGLGDPEDW